MVFINFWFWLTLSERKKLKNLIFEMLVIWQTLKMNNLRTLNMRTASAKSINVHNLRKFIKGFLRKVLVKTVFVYRLWDIAARI